mmetsp:Transcript_55779/g.143731  ORF Transcript_55779/g.143731 Transcript_55779/m.143731 type:complete len:85 (+) Transcript_55779:190-444(+)
MARSLDVPARQVAIDVFDDPQFAWHHRVLLIGAGNGRWIVGAPDLEVQYADLSEQRVVPLPRAAAFPLMVRDNIWLTLWCRTKM